MVGLGAAADVQLRKFSKGMLQRAGIAQAILHDPQVVFLDEPMSGLDPVGRREVRDIILQLKQQGRTVFFSTHILSDAEMLCDRVAVLVGGKLQGVGAPGDIVSFGVHGMEILFEGREGSRAAAHSPNAPAHRRPLSHRSAGGGSLSRRSSNCASCEARILSVSPVRPTLEDYFLRLVDREKCAVACRRGDDPMSAMPGVVAINTFREAVRDRVLYNLVFFALLMIGAAILVGQISIGIDRLVIINLGLSAISIFGLVMAVFIGVGLVYKEIEKRTLYSLLSKPIRRWQFLVGKYAGLLLTLAVNTALMTLGLAAALFTWGGRSCARTPRFWWPSTSSCWNWRW